MKRMRALALWVVIALWPLSGYPQGAETAKTSLTALNSAYLPSADRIQEWHAFKDRGGPTLAGSPSWKTYLEFLEKKFREEGLLDIKRDSVTYRRWYTSDDKIANRWSLVVDGEAVDVASYWAYSGSTGASGTTAPLIYYDVKQPPPSIQGRIVVFEIPPSPRPPGAWFRMPGFEFATDADSFPKDSLNSEDTVTFSQWYQLTYATIFGKLDKIVAEGKPAGSLVIFDMGPERLKGLYTFPLPAAALGVPGLYVDRVAGRKVKEAALRGHPATVRLLASEEDAEAYYLSGILPGRNYGREGDEFVLLITHTDGPSLTQENGAFGVLGVVEYFSRIPREQRPRSLLVLLDPSHFMPRGRAPDWFRLNPGLAAKIVASVGIEHLGQREYRERGNEFGPTGRPELAGLFAQDNDRLIQMAIQAVETHRLPRTLVQSPPRKGQGVWYGMGKVALERRIPGYGIMGYMGAHWASAAHLATFDKDLMVRQVAVMTQLTGALMEANLRDIAVPQSP